VSNNVWRILTSLLAAPVFLAAAYVGGWVFGGLIAVIGMAGQRELYTMARRVGAGPQDGVGLALGGLVIVAMVDPSLWVLPATGLVALVVAAPFLVEQNRFLVRLAVTLAGGLYPTGLLGGLVLLREGGATGTALVVMTVFLVWATDTCAYYTGRWLGRHPLAPAISPNKTWEGTLGGVGGAVLVAAGAALVVPDLLAWGHWVVLVGIAGAVGQAGDLVESQLKRSTDMDDASTLLPGHGGVLDRFDAMAVVAPLVYLYLHVVAGVV
jgi:phosphatidate cytidylyltransferase